jgi:hypothetical protein
MMKLLITSVHNSDETNKHPEYREYRHGVMRETAKRKRDCRSFVKWESGK